VVVPLGDRIVSPADGAGIAGAIPDARYEALPGVGHALQFEAREQVAALIRDFLG
jgi:pimeloyl-ACP methyl ester carboxylesterase